MQIRAGVVARERRGECTLGDTNRMRGVIGVRLIEGGGTGGIRLKLT